MPFVYDLELAHSEPGRMFVQQLVAVGTLVGTGQSIATLSDGSMDWHIPAPRQGLLVEWFREHGSQVEGGDLVARIVCEGERVEVLQAVALRVG